MTMAFVVAPSRNPIIQAAWAGLEAQRRGDAKASKAVGKPEVAHPKENAVQSEPYRRLVAARPCINCNVHGFSQAAHPPPTGKGRKEDDRLTFSLCCTRPGVTGCHVEFDQRRLIPPAKMRTQAAKWGKETRAAIRAEGAWPKRLAQYPGDAA